MAHITFITIQLSVAPSSRKSWKYSLSSHYSDIVHNASRPDLGHLHCSNTCICFSVKNKLTVRCKGTEQVFVMWGTLEPNYMVSYLFHKQNLVRYLWELHKSCFNAHFCITVNPNIAKKEGTCICIVPLTSSAWPTARHALSFYGHH